MEQNKEQLIELFIDCIDKRRFISEISSKDEYDLQQRKTNEYSFNVNSFYRPKIYYKYMQLGILPKDIRPDFLLFHNSGESSIIEVMTYTPYINAGVSGINEPSLLNRSYKFYSKS